MLDIASRANRETLIKAKENSRDCVVGPSESFVSNSNKNEVIFFMFHGGPSTTTLANFPKLLVALLEQFAIVLSKTQFS